MRILDNEWYCYMYAALTELAQSRDEGKDVSGFEERVNALGIYKATTTEEYKKVFELVDEIENLPEPVNPEFKEPSDLEGIASLREKRTDKTEYDASVLNDKINGAWLGRVAGCILGKPVENWHREDIMKAVKTGENWPVADDMNAKVDNPENAPELTYEFLSGHYFRESPERIAPADDDTDYTVLYLVMLEQFGKDFSSDDVAETWLENFNIKSLCTAEQAAYRNFVGHILPPESSSYRNPYREWIGAQIRGDMFGYVNPGDPFAAADMAYRDACCTHTKNGIYGEMFVAAMIAEAAVSSSPEHCVKTGLKVIPKTSRLYRDVNKIIDYYENGLTYEEMLEKLFEQYPHNTLHNSVHTIPNAMIVAAALLYGKGDFTKTIGYAVMAGMDTDCNCATAGSVIGMLRGENNIPERFKAPFCDMLETNIPGCPMVKISEMAERTIRIIG